MVYLKVILRLILPFVYCLVTGGLYAYVMKKDFTDSLAPCFFVQIIIMIMTGMMGSVNAGIILWIVIVCVGGVVVYIRRLGTAGKHPAVKTVLPDIRDDFLTLVKDRGFIVFTIIYMLIWALNYDKCFRTADEFSHWGMFLKETLRIDRLYCTSPVGIVHKTYFPGITMFEALWCRLSLGYSEANSYRGIQMLASSMMFPMIMRKKEMPADSAGKPGMISLICRTLIIFGIPLFFSYDFYHSIYQDLIFGVFVAFCMYLIITDDGESYTVFLLVLALFMLIMAKMTAVAFVPMIVLFYLVHIHKHVIRRGLILMGAPFGMMYILNAYIKHHVSGTDLSFSIFTPEAIWAVISHNGVITYQNDVERGYFTKLFTDGVCGRIPFVAGVIFLIVILLVWAYRVREDVKLRGVVRLTALWIGLAAIAYVIMMYFMYMLTLVEFEARMIASYSRYMGSFMLGVVLMSVSMYMYYSDDDDTMPMSIGAFVLIGSYMMFGAEGIDQIFPGPVSIGSSVVKDSVEYKEVTDYINANTPEDTNIYVVNRGLKGGDPGIIRFYINPRWATNRSPGPEMFKDDVWSEDISVDKFAEDVSAYDYIFFMYYDAEFQYKYLEVFDNPEIVKQGGLYKINASGDGIELIREGVNDAQ